MDLGENIRNARAKLNMTQKELAESAGIAINSLRNYEANKRSPSTKILGKIADALKTSAPELMGLENMGGGFYGKEAGDDVYVKFAKNIQLHNAKARLNVAFDSMNELGQQKAVDNIEDLAKIPEYQKAGGSDAKTPGE